MEYNCNYGVLHYHDTPWNNKLLLGNSLEIELIESNNGDEINLINEFCLQKKSESYVLVASRISESQIDLKRIYFSCGFITVEHTLNVSSYGQDLNKISYILRRFPVIVEDFRSENLKEVEYISADEINFGRFHEDPFIEKQIAKNRNILWIDDLINQEATLKVLMKKSMVLGFMAYKIKDNKANLLLGGIKEKYRHLAYGFWANILSNIPDSIEINALISSSNVDVINLYSYFGFKFSNPQFGFHRHL